MGLLSRASLHTWGRRGSARAAAHRTAPGPFRAPHNNHRCMHARLYEADLLFALGLSQAPPGSPWSVAQARGCRPVGFSVCRPHPASERSGRAPNRASGNMQQDRQEQCNATTHGPNNKKLGNPRSAALLRRRQQAARKDAAAAQRDRLTAKRWNLSKRLRTAGLERTAPPGKAGAPTCAPT